MITSALITITCILTASVICRYTYRLRPHWFGCLVYVVFGSYAVIVVCRHALAQFGVEEERWFVIGSALVLLPLHHTLLPVVCRLVDEWSGATASRVTVESKIESYLDSLVQEQQ